MARITKEEIKAFQNIPASNVQYDTYLDILIPALEESVDRFTRRRLEAFDFNLKEIVSQMAKFKIDELTRQKNIRNESINGDYSVGYTNYLDMGSMNYPTAIESALSKYRVLFDPATVKLI